MRRTTAAALSALLVTALVMTTGGAATPVFGTPVKAGSGVTEPGINFSTNGTVFVDGPAGFPGHSKLWRSTDGNGSYQAVSFGRPFDKLPGGGDSDVVTRGNRVFFLDLWLGSNSIAVSEDNGDTWTLGTPFTSLPASDRQWIALGDRDPITGLDTVYVLYALIQQPRSVMLARSRTSGLTWDFHTFAPGVGSASGYTGQLESDGSKFLAFTWEDGGVLRAATSPDEGQTWRTGTIASDAVGVIPGGTLSGDHMHAAWVERGSFVIKTASSYDKGLNWSAPTALSATGTSNTFPWVDASGDKVSVAWYGANVGGNPLTVPPTTVWTTRYRESLDGGLTWSDEVTLGTAKTGIICTQGLSCDPALGGPGGRELGDFLTVTIDDATALAHVAFGGRVGIGVRVAKQIS